jgi:L-iditol 2-dehydrogenase
MKALFYPSFGELIVDEQPFPELAADEVLIKVLACGICGSELETFSSHSTRRMPPIIMGHEFCGIVTETGPQVNNISPGAYAVSNSIISCGKCPYCQSGATNLCRHREVFGMHRNGAFAEYVNVPARCLIPFSDQVDPRAVCLTEPLANGVHMVRLTRHVPLENLLIIGAGPIGLMALQAFRALRDVSVIVADLKDERLEVAKSLGAAYTFNPEKVALEEAIKELTAGEGVDMVIDAVGMKKTNDPALRLTRLGGTVVMIGLHENSSPFHSYDIILTEKKIIGTYAATREDMITALDLISGHKVDVSTWVSYYPLSEGVTAFEDMRAARGNHIKSVIQC